MGGMSERIVILAVFVGWQGWRYLEAVTRPAPAVAHITMTAALCAYIMLSVLALRRFAPAVRILAAILLLVGAMQLVVAAYRDMGEAGTLIGMLCLLGSWRLKAGLKNLEEKREEEPTAPPRA